MRERHPRPPAVRTERTRLVNADQLEQFYGHAEIPCSYSSMRRGYWIRAVIARSVATKQSILALTLYGLLRFARNDERWVENLTTVMPRAGGASSTPGSSCDPRTPAFTGSSAFADDDSRELLHHRRGLPEQHLALFLGADRRLAEIRIDLFGHRVGAHRGRPLADGLEPALEMRKVVDVLALVLVPHHPGIARHIRDRIIAGDELAILQAFVEHAVEPVGLVHIAVDGVFDFFLGVITEVMVLPRHRTEPAHLPERPLNRVVTAVDVGRKEFAGLLRQIQQHRAGFEDRNRLAAALRLMIEHRGNAVVGRDRQKLRLELVALADVDRENLVFQPSLFQKHRDLVAVRRGPVMKVDHGASPSCCGFIPGMQLGIQTGCDCMNFTASGTRSQWRAFHIPAN